MQWAEGMVFQAFLTEDRILRIDEMPILTRDEYLGGVLDFTGELNRYAVKCATERDIPAVQKCRDVVDSLMGIFLEVRAHLPQPCMYGFALDASSMHIDFMYCSCCALCNHA